MQRFETLYKDILPLGNLHILEQENASEILAIFFSLGSVGFNSFYKSEVLQNLCEKYAKNISFKGILQVQYTLLLNISSAIKAKPKETKEILKQSLENLKTLEQNNLLSNPFLDTIKEYFNELLAFKEIQTKIPQNTALMDNFLEQSLKILESNKANLEQILNNFSHLQSKNELEILLNKLKNQKFTIGVTGVLSAGKSTLLNALLGGEILGTSTIPETASLTLLRYGEKNSANICFWNKKEWSDVEETLQGETKEALFKNSDFLEAKEHFIKEQSFSKDIEMSLLPSFTSANAKEQYCFLIKQTTLFTPLKFLENNITIVDTPGLDDPVIQREEITKGYLKECDLLIHAMNASQSATQIDIDFILYALNSANIARILIVLTHADLLRKEDLTAALNYTKQSLQEKLEQNLPNDLSKILLKKVEFLSIASYPALICKINPNLAKEKGFSLKDSNFLALEEYLDKTLLGSNSTKAKDIIFATTQGFKRYFKSIQNALLLEKSLLFAKDDEAKEIIKQEQNYKQNALLELKQTNELLESLQLQLKEFLSTLQNSLKQKLESAKTLLLERIFADIIYDLEKNKGVNKDRLDYMLDLGLKDLLSEILRFNTQSLDKKISQLNLQFSSSLEKFGTAQKLGNFNTNLDSTIITKTKLKMLNAMLKNSPKFNKNDKIELKNMLEVEFNAHFLELLEYILQTIKCLENDLILSFKESLNAIKAQKEEELKTKELALQNALNFLEQNLEQKEQKLEQLTQALSTLEVAFSDFSTLEQLS